MATGILLTPPIVQFLSNAGLPAVNGSVLTQVGGINTATYADVNLTTPLPNPIPLNSRGEISTAAGASSQCFLTPNIVYVFTLFDGPNGTGNQLWQATYVNGLGITQASIGAALYPQTTQENAAGVTPTNLFIAPGIITRYGATNASADNTAALQAAANQAAQAGGAEVYAPPGNWNFASTTSAVCALGSNVTIRGAGKSLTIFTVTGVAVTAGFFTGTNLSNVKISDLAIVGNSQANSFANGGAVYFSLTSAATAQIGNYAIERCAFSNFKATYWVAFFATGTAVQSFGMQTIRVHDCDFTSLTGNAQNGASVTFPAHCIAVLGGFAPAATMKDVEVSGCTADCTFIKGFFITWGGGIHINVHHNIIKNVGSSSQISDDSGSYALSVYQNQHYAISGISNASSAVVTAVGHTFSNGDYVTIIGIVDNGFSNGVPSTQGTLMAALNWQTVGPISGVAGNNFTIPVNTTALATYVSGGAASNLAPPDLCEFANNIVDGMRDAGIYMATTNRITISNNTFTGQTSVADSSIPKAAIALNQDLLPTVDDNVCYNCAISISIVPAILVSQNIRNTEIYAIPTNAVGIKISPSGTGCVGEVIISGLKIEATATGVTGVKLFSNSTIAVANFEMRFFKITCPNIGFYQFSTDASVPALGNVNIENGTCQNFTGYGIRYSNCSNAATRAVIEDISFKNPVANAIMLAVNSSSGLTIRDMNFNDMTTGTGFAIISGSAQGRMLGCQFNNVAVANRFDTSANRMGVDVPTWTGNINDFVQDLNIFETGSASSKYVRLGWTWDRVAAAWKECRALTGN